MPPSRPRLSGRPEARSGLGLLRRAVHAATPLTLTVRCHDVEVALQGLSDLTQTVYRPVGAASDGQ